MTEIIVWVLMSYGLMNIMVFGSIFQNLRDSINKWGENDNAPFQELGKFISGILRCPMCFSTWSGFFLGFFFFSPTWEFLDIDAIFSWFFDGIFSSGAVWMINSIVEWFEENRPAKN